MMYQVAIIGGGLAGLALAIDLRKKSYHVIIIEKGNYPRQKVCGEYISMESHNYLFSLCPSLEKLNLPSINKFLLTSTGKNSFEANLPLGGFGISRYLLEELLYQEAYNLGVDFSLNTKASTIDYSSQNSVYNIKTSKNTIQASLVCNSSGRKSNFETAIKENRTSSTNYIGIKYHIKLKRDSSLIEIHNFPGGYCGVSNIEDDKSCLCYIVNSKKLQEVNNSIPELEKKILFKNTNLKTIIETAQFITPQPVTISGINFKIKNTVNDESLFLGDSAGSIAPITGNGMSMALRSASELAKNIDSYFSNIISNEDLKINYSAFWKKQFSTRIKLSRHFQKLSEHPPLTNFTIQLFNTFPNLAQKVIKLTHGNPF